MTMEIPTVKSCGPFTLNTIGLMIGFLQMVFHSLAFLFAVRFGLLLMTPMILVGVAIEVAWIYGIQEKKVIFMIPAFIPFIIASLSGIVALLMCPIVISTRILAGDHPVHTQDSELFAFLTVMIVTSIVTYLTIVKYSLCKSLEEQHRIESTRMPFNASCPPQTLHR